MEDLTLQIAMEQMEIQHMPAYDRRYYLEKWFGIASDVELLPAEEAYESGRLFEAGEHDVREI